MYRGRIPGNKRLQKRPLKGGDFGGFGGQGAGAQLTWKPAEGLGSYNRGRKNTQSTPQRDGGILGRYNKDFLRNTPDDGGIVYSPDIARGRATGFKPLESTPDIVREPRTGLGSYNRGRKNTQSMPQRGYPQPDSSSTVSTGLGSYNRGRKGTQNTPQYENNNFNKRIGYPQPDSSSRYEKRIGYSQPDSQQSDSQFEGLDKRIARLPGLVNKRTSYTRDRGRLAGGVEDAAGKRRGQYAELQNQFGQRQGQLDQRENDANRLEGGLGRREQEHASRDVDRQRRLGERGQRLSDYNQLDSRFRLGNNFGEQRNKTESASFNRATNLLREDFGDQEERLRTRLHNQGLAPGSEAFDDAVKKFSENRNTRLNDLALGSVAAGGQEHSRLADILSRNRAQQFSEGGQLFSEGGRLEDEASRRFGEGNQFFQNQREVFSDRGRLEDERARYFNQGLQNFGAGQQVFDSALQSANFGEGLNRGQEAENQRGFDRSLASRRQGFDEQSAANRVANQNERDRFGQDMQNRQFGLQNRQFGLQNRQFGLQNQQFGHQSDLQNRQFGLQDRQFGHQSDLQNRQFGLQDRQFGHQSDLQNRQFGLQDRQFGHQSGLQNRQFENQQLNDLFGQELAGGNFHNRTEQQRFQQDQILRNQGIKEMLLERDLPFQDLQRIMALSGQQQNPQFSPQQQWGVQAPDVTNSYGNMYNANLQRGNANASMWGDAVGKIPWGDIFNRGQK